MCCLKFESQTYQDNERIFGKNCKGCVPAVVDEFYDEQENRATITNLLKEDSIKEVDYQMMLETARSKRILNKRHENPQAAPKEEAQAAVNNKRRRPKGTGSRCKAADEKAPKKRRRPRRRKPKTRTENKGE